MSEIKATEDIDDGEMYTEWRYEYEGDERTVIEETEFSYYQSLGKLY